ncbi:hypothetical protein GCM10027021_38840 [Dyella kyungheensis]
MNSAHDHLVTIDPDKRCVRLFRVMPDGEKVLYTELELPKGDAPGWTDDVVRLAQRLGEDLLMDSPTARNLLAL